MIDILFSQVNIILTILMLILVLYWLVTMISGIDLDVDIDVDFDIESNIEGTELDFQDVSNTELNKEDLIKTRREKLKWWQVFLIYFNFVDLPFMFTFTCWVFIWWILTTITTTLTYSYNNTFGFIIMISGFFPALIITKIFTTPFKSFFKNLNKDGDLPIDIVGRRGVCLSTIKNNKMGSAEVVVEGNSLSIYIKSLNGENITFREPILIIKKSEDKNYYYVQSYKTN